MNTNVYHVELVVLLVHLKINVIFVNQDILNLIKAVSLIAQLVHSMLEINVKNAHISVVTVRAQ